MCTTHKLGGKLSFTMSRARSRSAKEMLQGGFGDFYFYLLWRDEGNRLSIASKLCERIGNNAVTLFQ